MTWIFTLAVVAVTLGLLYTARAKLAWVFPGIAILGYWLVVAEFAVGPVFIALASLFGLEIGRAHV